ncbi:DUF6477 family protein [Paracoccus yeei]|uniref:DUF6477 family protein n=1 Tax=Paracoccus yeei TaxID=147645 RepID=UPI003BF8438A
MTMMPNVIQFQPRRADPVTRPFRRPRLLVQAARAGLNGWNRKRDLRRLLKCDDLPEPGAALPRLAAEEARLDQARREAQADYDLQRHILLLVAIIAETAGQMRHMAPVGGAAITSFGTAIPARP